MILKRQIQQQQMTIDAWKESTRKEVKKQEQLRKELDRMEQMYQNVNVDSLHERIASLESRLELAKRHMSSLDAENQQIV